MFDARLKYAVAVGRCGSFSRAADASGVTQSAVTKSVADLERHIGFSLFHRTSHGARLTDEGREFIDRAARLLADADELMDNRKHKADPYAGTLRIGLFPGSIDWLVTEPLLSLLKYHSAARIEIATGNSERGIHLLSRGDIDVAFGLEAAFSRWPQFKCERVATVEMVPFVRADHPILLTDHVDKEALTKFEFITPSSSEPYTAIIQQMYEEFGIRPSDKIHMIDHFPLVRRVVSSTNALGTIARKFTHGAWFQNNFRILEETNLLDPLILSYAVRLHWPVKPSAKKLISFTQNSWR